MTTSEAARVKEMALRHADDALVLQRALVHDVWQVHGRVMEASDAVPQYLWQPAAACAAGGPASWPPG